MVSGLEIKSLGLLGSVAAGSEGVCSPALKTIKNWR